MEEVGKVIMFFFRAEAVVLLIYLFLRGLHFNKEGDTASITHKDDSDVLYVLTIFAVLASFVYSWCI